MPNELPESAAASCSQLVRILTDGSRIQLGIIRDSVRDLVEMDPGRAREDVIERIQRSVGQLGTLISDVSDFHAHAAGRVEESDSAFDLRVTMEGVRDRLSQLGAGPAWTTATRIRHDVPTLLRGRPARLQDILLGPASEMLPLWPAGHLQMDVSIAAERGESVDLRIRCTLAPPGLPTASEIEAFRTRLEPPAGTTLDRQRLRSELSRRLVAAAGGRFELVTESEGALQYEVTLPFGLRETPAAAPVRGRAPGLRRRRALIVDVSAWRRSQMGRLLELWGVSFDACDSAAAAVEALAASNAARAPYDLVLVDSELGDVAGAGRALRTEGSARTRLMLLYSVGMRGDAAAAERAGFEAYLPHTISIHELREAMEILLQRIEDGSAVGELVTQHSLADVRLEGAQVLIVSDDGLGSMVIESVLRRKGFHVDRARNVAEGGVRCEQGAYDFLIVDLDGLPEAEWPLVPGLRGMSAGRRTFMAGLVGPHLPESALADIVPDATFVKPVDLERICLFCESALYPDLADAPARGPRVEAVTIVSSVVDPEESAVFEPERLAQSTMGDEALQQTVVGVYIGGMPRRVDLLATALRAGDFALAENEAVSAHALALTVGAVSTARCLEAIAHLAREQRSEGVDPLLEQLRAEVVRSAEALRASRPGPEAEAA